MATASHVETFYTTYANPACIYSYILGFLQSTDFWEPPPPSPHTDLRPSTMSFGFSLSDIVFSCQLASDLHYHCFTKAQRAGEFHIPLARDSA